jgi:hypothetical protein
VTPRQGRWRIRGLYLPDEFLRKVYEDNALRPDGGRRFYGEQLLNESRFSFPCVDCRVENSAAPDIKWAAQVSLLRPGFLLANGFTSRMARTHLQIKPRSQKRDLGHPLICSGCRRLSRDALD